MALRDGTCGSDPSTRARPSDSGDGRPLPGRHAVTTFPVLTTGLVELVR